MIKLLTTILFLGFSISVYTQNKQKIDSLHSKLKIVKTDTAKIKVLNNLSAQYYNFDLEAAQKFAEQALALAKKLNYQKSIAESLNSLADVFFYKGNHEKSKEFYRQSLKIYETEKDKKGISLCIQDLATIFREEGNFPEAINYYQQALKINEDLGNQKGVAYANVNIGVLFTDLEKYDKALEYLLKALDVLKNSNEPAGLANCYARVGNVYWSQKQFAKAINYYNQSLEGFIKIGHQRGIAVIYNNLAGVHDQLGDKKSATDYYEKALIIRKQIGDKNGVVIILNNLGILYSEKKDYDVAINYYNQSLAIAKEINFKDLIKENYQHLSKSYSKMKNFNKAYEYHVLFSELKDSLYNEKSSKQFAELNTKYESDKKEKEILLLNKEKTIQKFEIDKKKDEIKKHQILIGFIVLIVLIFIALSFFIFRMYKIKRKANILLALKNQEIEQQKEEITTQKDYLLELNEELQQQKEEIITQRDEIEKSRELLQYQKNIAEEQRDMISEQNMEITNSINYAKYIQKAILVPMEDVMKIFSEHFIFFKPRDIVSGDFYWAKKNNVKILQENNLVSQDYLIIAAADCTGHGVPGAIMSMLGTAYLSEIVNGFTLQSVGEEPKASQILEDLRKNIIESLHQTGKSGEQKDGMDIALCVINIKTMEMQFAGANNPCYVIANTQPVIAMAQPEAISTAQSDCFVPRNDEYNFVDPVIELVEIKGDKQPIGIHSNMQPFTNQKFQLQKDDIIYLMSDGYEDQFGGPNRKKFLAKNLKNLLITNCQLPMADQKEILFKSFESWRGENPQVDDILVMAFKCNI